MAKTLDILFTFLLKNDAQHERDFRLSRQNMTHAVLGRLTSESNFIGDQGYKLMHPD